MRNEKISDLEGEEVGPLKISVGNQSEGRFPEETNFELYLKNKNGEKSQDPVVRGKYFSGRGKTYTPWIEFDFKENIK